MGGSLHYKFGGLIFGGAYTWMGLFSEFYGMCHDLPVENAIADLPSMLKENSKAFPVNKLSLLGGPRQGYSHCFTDVTHRHISLNC